MPTASDTFLKSNRRWKPFQWPLPLLKSSCTISGPLLMLHNEILLLILKYLPVPDRMVLALVCKHLFQLCFSVGTTDATWDGTWIWEHKNLVQEFLKQIRPTESDGRPSKEWGLCTSCLQWRPVAKSYWETKLVRAADTAKPEHWRIWDKLESARDAATRLPGRWPFVKNGGQCPECFYEVPFWRRDRGPGKGKPRAVLVERWSRGDSYWGRLNEGNA